MFHEETQRVWCIFCDRYDTAVVIGVPNAFKLFSQELSAIGLNLKMHVEPE